MIDPIEELGALAREYDIPLHVDACVGGYLLPFVEKLGYHVPKFDFRVQGVTSISADAHKYGYSAKGASTILYRNVDYLKHRIFVSENWPGGVFASATILGTRPGGAIAAAPCQNESRHAYPASPAIFYTLARSVSKPAYKIPPWVWH